MEEIRRPRGNYQNQYNVDIALCIDTTGSMRYILDTVKRNALNFHDDIKRGMEAEHKPLDQLRVRIVAFRDYLADGEMAMRTTPFFSLPEQTADFEAAVNSLHPDGGGDDPEDGLEALAFAMKSDWNRNGYKRRHIIVVWTDDGTHPLGYGKASPYYPKGMLESFDDLTDMWGDALHPGYMDNEAKRLLIYAPEMDSWSTISDCWGQVIHYPSEAGMGLEGLDYKQIIEQIVNSITVTL